MTSERGFWQSGFGKFIRWLVFLPIGFVLGSVLQSIPPIVVAFAASYKPQFSFLVLILALIVLSMLLTCIWLWGLAVFGTPYLSCRVIAPNHRVASVIFATLFIFCELAFILGLIGRREPWILVIYNIIFSAIFVGGCVVAYKEDT